MQKLIERNRATSTHDELDGSFTGNMLGFHYPGWINEKKMTRAMVQSSNTPSTQILL